jgi:hypothetical protein
MSDPTDSKQTGAEVNINRRALGMGIVLAAMVLFFAPQIRGCFLPDLAVSDSPESFGENASSELKKVQSRLRSSQARFARLTPGSPYLIVDTSHDYFYLMGAGKIIREGMCSTGSSIMLQSHDDRAWVFKTPRGMFRIRGKTERPIWKKPDWAFIEEGLPVPAADAYERFERGVLGDYALAIGDGYLIHGTLYKRFLGIPVTHGCIRMGDEDLESVYQALDISSKVFIY